MSLRDRFAGSRMPERDTTPTFARPTLVLRLLYGGKNVTRTGPGLSLLTPLCLVGATICMVAILALHLGLLTRGAWAGDEYAAISRYRDQGVAFLWFRFWSWSPRPLSEALIWLYAAAVVAARQPLIVPALAGFWALMIAAPFIALFRCARDTVAPRALSAVTILAFIVLGQHVAAVLYWPFGAVAYAPVIAALLFLLFFLANESTGGKAGSITIAAVLVIAAWSSEIGALLASIYCGMAVGYLLWSMRRSGTARSHSIWWAPPVVASLVVMAMIGGNHRASFPMLPGGDPGLYHHTLASLEAALIRLPQEFAALDGETFDRANFVRGICAKLLFFMGLHFCWSTGECAAPRGKPWLPLLALSIAIGMVGILGGSFQEFGTPCCDRHAFMRQSLGWIATAAMAIWMPPLLASLRRWQLIIAPMALVIAAGLMIRPRVYDLREDYHYFSDPAEARARTMASGWSDGPAMTLYLPYSDQLFPSQIPAGSYVAADNWWAPGILDYYHKQTVQVRIAPSRGAE